MIFIVKDWMEKHKETTKRLGERFTDIADWVSSAMGTPVNIIIWVILVLGWTLLYAVHPALQNANFLPSWFTSQAYNFPLNLITTVAELFIGFLVAAASNRIERRNHQQMERLDRMEKQTLRMEHEHGKMIAELRTIITDLHSHTTCNGHTTIDSTPVPEPHPEPAPATKGKSNGTRRAPDTREPAVNSPTRATRTRTRTRASTGA